MSSELKIMLRKVAMKDNERKEIEFEEGINRNKSLLLRVAKVKPFVVLVSSEGTEQSDMKQTVLDLDVLERARLMKGQTKETNHNVYRQYELTPEGAALVEKFSKETIIEKEAHQPHTLGASSSQEIPVRGAEPNQIPCPDCGNLHDKLRDGKT
jgi:hypothetical protein